MKAFSAPAWMSAPAWRRDRSTRLSPHGETGPAGIFPGHFLSWFSSKLVVTNGPLGIARAVFCRIRATDGGNSIFAGVPEGGSRHLRGWFEGQTRPGRCSRSATRFVAVHSAWRVERPSGCLPAATAAACPRPLPSSVNIANAVVTTEKGRGRAGRRPTARITASLQLDGRRFARSDYAAPHGPQVSTSDSERLSIKRPFREVNKQAVAADCTNSGSNRIRTTRHVSEGGADP